MKIQERTPSYRRRTYGGLDDQYEGGLKQTFAAQVLICILILMFCVLVKLYPGENFEKAKNSVQLIVTQNTDIKAEFEKLKANFKKDESLETLNPVSGMAAPSSGKIVKGFGIQDASGSGFHYGLDLSCGETENIVAANDGEVTEIATNAEFGSYIIIRHSEEITTLYGQLNEILPNVGDKVTKGQAIARAGGENSTFYFELRRGDTYLDPTQFIEFKE